MSTEKTVYFVRHGQSEANVSPIFQPLDSPLTSTGRAQAEQIAARVARLPFDLLVSSPLARTKDTCEAIANATGKVPEYSDLFVERFKPSGLEGKLHSDPAASAAWSEWNETLYTPGSRVRDGECFDDLLVRADAALAFLAEKPEKDIVVVTHGWFLRTLFARVLLGDTLTGDAFRTFQSKIEMENTGLSVLKYGKRFDGIGWYVWIYNDHTHLG